MADIKKVYHVDRNNTRSVIDVRNAFYSQPDASEITCDILFAEFATTAGYIPFTASHFDEVAVGRDIYRDLAAGMYGDVVSYDVAHPQQEEG